MARETHYTLLILSTALGLLQNTLKDKEVNDVSFESNHGNES
jgi:hypothetical protein